MFLPNITQKAKCMFVQMWLIKCKLHASWAETVSSGLAMVPWGPVFGQSEANQQVNESGETYGRRHKLSNTLVFRGYITGLTKKTVLPRNRSRKMISGWYSVYPAPNGVAGLFRFGGDSGFANIWWLYESTVFYSYKTSCPKTSLDDGQLLGEIIVTVTASFYIPMSKPVPNQMPD